jgi:hypothetical protein
MTRTALGLAAIVALSLPTACLADDLKANERFNDMTLDFEITGPYRNATLSVAGPGDFHTSVSAERGAPSIDLRKFGPLADGTYTYQLDAATDQKLQAKTRLDNGRKGSQPEPMVGASMSGTFNVKDGAIVKRETKPRTSRRDQD